MNVLGHAYIAAQLGPVRSEKQLLIIGSLLPESFPFMSNLADFPFINEEIHEGGLTLLRYLDNYCPQKRSLALGIMAHSSRFGADGWNKEVEEYYYERKHEYAERIAQLSQIPAAVAQSHLHNFFWWVIDWRILETYPSDVEEIKQAIMNVNIENTADLLAKGFSKDYGKVYTVVGKLFRNLYQPDDFNDLRGLMKIWARQAAGLPEKDKVNVDEAVILVEELSGLIGNEWRNVLQKVEEKVRENMQPYLNPEGRKKEII